MATVNTNALSNSIDDKSFALLRTNPKLTSNIKLLVNSNGDLYLSSFRANKELSKINYQKYEVHSSGTYSIDVSKFYKKLPLTQRYETLRNFSDVTLFSDYEFQYEDQYQYGAIQNSTKLYDEQYKLFAPIWLEKTIPSKFIIYRIDGVDYTQENAQDTVGQNSRILELLKNATIIKTFDLGKSSKIGEYLNSHVNHRRFPESLLTVNFKQDSQSTFNGIDILNGGFVSKAEQLDSDYIQVDYPEIFNNQTITNGFERNGLISANIVNLEFLFDDNTAEKYKIYRYFGVYVDDIDEGMFGSTSLDAKGNLNVNNLTYDTLYDLSSSPQPLTDIDMFPGIDQFQIPSIQYVKDKFGNFYNIKNSTVKLLDPGNSPTSDPIWSYKFLISKNESTEDNFVGFSKNGKILVADIKKPSYKGFIKLKLKDFPWVNDKIFIGDKTELKTSKYNLGDYVIIADDMLPAGRANKNKFSNQGSLQQVAIAMSSAINNGEIITYKTVVVGTTIVIEEIVAGNRRRQTAFGVYKSNLIDFIEVTDGEYNDIGLNSVLIPSPTVTNFSHWDIWTPISGSIEGKSLLVKSTEIGDLKIGEYFKQKNSNKFVRIIEINEDPFDENFYRIVFSGNVDLSTDRLFEVYEEYKTVHGRFAAYDFKDFDFDFYSTRNSDLGDLKYDKLSDGSLVDATSFYAGLRDILSQETSKKVVKTELLNEYDRLKENSLKETALLSRMVPTICKYALKDASNARNLPYILNVNEAFGDDNLSPNIEIDSKRNIEYFNMEHLHLNKIPLNILGQRNSLNNYLDFEFSDGLTIDRLKDTNFDYFDKHFNWNGYYDPTITSSQGTTGVWFNNQYKRNWTKFDTGNFEKNSSTVFRGLRYVFQKRKETENEIPTEFLKGVNVNDYKFGAYLSYNTGDDITSNSVVYNCIKNDKFKFICVNVELNVVKNDIGERDLNRNLIYTLNDITDGTYTPAGKADPIPKPVNTLIPFGISISTAIIGLTEDEPFIIKSSENDAKFTEFIKRDAFGEFSWILFDYGADVYGIKVVDVIDDTSILVAGWPWKWSTQDGSPSSSPFFERMSPIDASLISPTIEFTYFKGGSNEFSNLLDSISAYKYSRRFNLFEKINYITVDEGIDPVFNDFIISIESGVDIVKPSIIVPAADPDKPKAFRISSNQIGNIIEDREDGGYAVILRRMNGNYNPLFNDIVTFSDIYSSQKINVGNNPTDVVLYNKHNGNGIAFDSFKENVNNYGFISNYFYHKVNEQDSKNILKLSQTSDKLPLYPMIGEIAIDKKEMNVFTSKYSNDYFVRSLPLGENNETNGTLSPVEKKTFMVSTIMKVEDTYDITKFDNTLEASIETLDKIRFAQTNKTSIHWVSEDSQIIADFYLPMAILNELIEDGIEQRFKNYVNPANSFGDKSSLKDDLQIYSKSNISTRFIIDSIKIYGIEFKGLDSNFISVNQTSELTKDNYRELTNFNIQSYQNDSLSFRLIYNKKRGYSYNFKIHVKIQA